MLDQPPLSKADVITGYLVEPFFCPHAGLAQASLQLKCLLQHQPWSLEYNIENDELVRVIVVL